MLTLDTTSKKRFGRKLPLLLKTTMTALAASSINVECFLTKEPLTLPIPLYSHNI